MFGEEVKWLADTNGITQKALADACGVNQSFISKLMRGEQVAPRADMLFKLAEALGVKCEHFKPFLLPEAAPAAEAEAPPPATKPKKAKKK